MSALSYLQQKNGLKTTQNVVAKQQSGEDAAEKAEPQMPAVLTEERMNAMGRQIDRENSAVPQDEAMKAARARTIATQQAIGKGVDVNRGAAPDEDDVPDEAAAGEGTRRRMSFVDMFKAMNGESGDETDALKARRQKRERTNAIIASVGDGLRALGNMYFATKGAKVEHNPERDMTAAMLKRRQMIDAQREKNRSAWLSGYQKAAELDELASKNDRTIAETIRHHKALEDAATVKAGQGQQRIDQNQQKIDLAKMKYTDDKSYRDNVLEIRKAETEGRLKHWEAQDAIARLRAEKVNAKASAAAGDKKTNAGYWYEYYDMMEDPEGRKKLDGIKRTLKVKNISQTNIRYIMDRVKGRKSGTAGDGNKPGQHKDTASAAPAGKGKKKARPY